MPSRQANATAKALSDIAVLFEDEARWSKGHEARDVNTKSVPPEHPDAVCWCIYGAVIKVVGDDEEPATNRLVANVTTKLAQAQARLYPEFETPPDLNDSSHTTIDDIRAVVHEAQSSVRPASSLAILAVNESL